MAENVFTQRFCDIVKKQICTTSADLNFDNYTAAGTYEIHENLGNGQNRVYFLTVDKSAGGNCTQTRTYCGKVEYRNCTSDGTWTEWESRTGGGSGGSGEDGGYYIPSLEQIDENTAQMHFSPSKGDMPAVSSAILELPSGGSGANVIILNYNDYSFNSEEIYNAYTSGAFVCLRGSHDFNFIDHANLDMLTPATGEFLIPLLSATPDEVLGMYMLTFGGSDNYGNGIEAFFMMGWELQVRLNLDTTASDTGSSSDASFMRIKYDASATLDSEAIYNAYQNGAYVCLEGVHLKDIYAGEIIVAEQAEHYFSIPLVRAVYNEIVGIYELTFCGSDGYGNGIEAFYGSGWTLYVTDN